LARVKFFSVVHRYGAGDRGYLGLAAEFPDDGCCRLHTHNFWYSEMKKKIGF